MRHPLPTILARRTFAVAALVAVAASCVRPPASEEGLGVRLFRLGQGNVSERYDAERDRSEIRASFPGAVPGIEFSVVATVGVRQRAELPATARVFITRAGGDALLQRRMPLVVTFDGESGVRAGEVRVTTHRVRDTDVEQGSADLPLGLLTRLAAAKSATVEAGRLAIAIEEPQLATLREWLVRVHRSGSPQGAAPPDGAPAHPGTSPAR